MVTAKKEGETAPSKDAPLRGVERTCRHDGCKPDQCKLDAATTEFNALVKRMDALT